MTGEFRLGNVAQRQVTTPGIDLAIEVPATGPLPPSAPGAAFVAPPPQGGGRSPSSANRSGGPDLPWHRGLLVGAEPRALLAGLWPQGIADARMRQGYIGDCYLVAYLHALKQHPIAPYLFAWMIRPQDNGRDWHLRFLNPTVKEVPVSRWDLAWASGWIAAVRALVNPVGFRGVSGQVGDRLLEKGVSRYRRMVRDAVRHRAGYVGAKGKKDLNATEALANFGGYARDIHDIMFTNAYAQYHSVGTHFMSFADTGPSEKAAVNRWLDRYGADSLPYIMHASTVHRKKHLPHGLIANHAYAVTHYDLQKKEVTVVNPHDTERGSVVLSLDAFCACFDILEITELKFDALIRTLGPMHFLQHRSFANEGGALIPHARYQFDSIAGRALQIMIDGHTITAQVNDGAIPEWKIAGLIEDRYRGQRLILGPYEWMEIGRERILDHPVDVALRHLHMQVERDGTMTLRDLGSPAGTTVAVVDRTVAAAPEPDIPWNERLTLQQEYRLTLAAMKTMPRLEIGDAQLAIAQNDFGQVVLHDPVDGIHIMLNEGEERTIGQADLGGNRYASRAHVRLRFHNGMLLITDCGSTNGTRLLFSEKE